MRDSSPSRTSIALTLACACFLATLLFAGCGKKASSDAANAASQPEATAAVAPSVPPAGSGPGPGEKTCFACNGSGIVACHAAGCKGGKVDCPGGCLKLSQGVWRHQDVAGHPASDLWISFHGTSGTTSWSQAHVGQVIVYQ